MHRPCIALLCAALAAVAARVEGGSEVQAGTVVPLRLAASDRIVNLPWVIAEQKGWLETLPVPVALEWLDTVTALDAFAAGHVDACVMTHADALVIGATTGRPSTAVILSGQAPGADVVVGRPGFEGVADLQDATVGVELGFVSHRLLLGALARAGIGRERVSLVNAPPETWEELLGSDGVDAIAAWEPGAGRLLAAVPGSQVLHRSTAGSAPFELVYVSRESLAARREAWLQVARLWDRSVAYSTDPANREDVLAILGARLELPRPEVEALFDGLILPVGQEALATWRGLPAADRAADAANLEAGIYSQPEASPAYLDPSLLESLLVRPAPASARH